MSLDDENLWQPGPKLAGRVAPSRATSRVSSGKDPRLLAAVIVVAAMAIAVSLWIAALWVRANDGSDDQPPIENEAAMSTLVPVTAATSPGTHHDA